MPNNGYFNAKRDSELITAGTHFWCGACLVAKPFDDQSPDPRYCQDCHDFLLKEVALLAPKQRRPEWIPKAKEISQKLAGVSGYPPLIMATVKSKKSEVAIIYPAVSTRPIVKRGPKRRTDLPIELITQWASEGMGYKRIAAKLKIECNITVGFRTVARIVAGQRVVI